MRPDPTANRRHSPAAERNAPPLLAQLQRLLPSTGLMLEIASGTGQHAAHFSSGLPGWQWQPSDAEEPALLSIATWAEGLPNLLPALHLDLLQGPWSGLKAQHYDALFCANMIHIAPWSCTRALMHAARQHLKPSGLLLTYGPYLESDVDTAASNLAFDADLRARNPLWGLRHRDDVAAEAALAGFTLRERVAMPANNLLLVWARAAA